MQCRCSSYVLAVKNVSNLCSGFSYCLTILDTLYVWHGCGSKQQERDAAFKYAQNLAAKGSTVVNLVEGESDDDEMFWMMLGEDDYAKADYWKWRRTTPDVNPRAWQVNADKGKNAVSRYEHVSLLFILISYDRSSLLHHSQAKVRSGRMCILSTASGSSLSSLDKMLAERGET